jgi:hypothetical protein
MALSEWLATVPEQRRRRDNVQRARCRTDADVLRRFSAHWTDPIGIEQQILYNTLHHGVVQALAIEEIPAAPLHAYQSTTQQLD